MKESIIQETTDALLALLPLKSRHILIARFGLKNNKPKTLAAIGQTLGITRERVRQIESASFKKLREAKKNKQIREVLEELSRIIKKEGGFLGMSGFEKIIFKKKTTLIQENQLKIILNSDSIFCYRKEDSIFSGIWYLKEFEQVLLKFINFYKCIIAYFENTKKNIKLNNLLKVILTEDFCLINKNNNLLNSEHTKNRLMTILQEGKLTGVNLLNEWGLKSWKLIKPRGIREKAYLVFQKHKKPLHFRDVTKLINKYFDLKRPAIPETVCNAVIYFDEFIAVEYGIYALAEWNLFDETIKSDIIRFLKNRIKNNRTNKQEHFIDINEIVKYVSKKQGKNIQSFVIQANLFDKKIFSRRRNMYTLKVHKN